MINLPSSFRLAVVGLAEMSFSMTALMSQDAMSLGSFSGSQVCR
jgi:hypothetical protein